jgi:hypothetical protein
MVVKIMEWTFVKENILKEAKGSRSLECTTFGEHKEKEEAS